VSKDFSKPIRMVDESSKKLIIDLLEGSETHGFDIDSIYYHRDYGWTIIEFLKCETVLPKDSHPNRYWFKNWRKFSAIWKLVKALGGTFFYVNYSDDKNQTFVVSRVIEMEVGEKGRIVEEDRKNVAFRELKEWYKEEINGKPGKLW